jgi:hypothetical protein
MFIERSRTRFLARIRLCPTRRQGRRQGAHEGRPYVLRLCRATPPLAAYRFLPTAFCLLPTNLYHPTGFPRFCSSSHFSSGAK